MLFVIIAGLMQLTVDSDKKAYDRKSTETIWRKCA